jgi:DNA replication and repair protein RecF
MMGWEVSGEKPGESGEQTRDIVGTEMGDIPLGEQLPSPDEELCPLIPSVSPSRFEPNEPSKTGFSPDNPSLIKDIDCVYKDFSLDWIHRIELVGFRNYLHESVKLGPGFNLVTGANAQGKTNLLEALYLLSTTRLLRGRRDHEAIRDGDSKMAVSAWLRETETELKITLEKGGRKRALLNGMSLPRAADLMGRLPSVTISTADLLLVRGDPSDRRLYLDLELSGLFPAYLRAFTLYRRAVEQRNALLKHSREHPVSSMQFEPWELEIAQAGAEIRQYRRRHVEELSREAAVAHGLIGDGEHLALGIDQADTGDDAQSLREGLEQTRIADIARGSTSLGPHRDDLSIWVDGRDARHFASQGQQRTAVIAIKLAGIPIGQRIFGKPPLLLLDDMLSDLDANRRQRLTDVVVSQAGQALLTCTEADAAGPHILAVAQCFRVDQGRVYA